jgi:hypothetical protein
MIVGLFCAQRFASEKIHSLNDKVLRQFSFGSSPFVTIEALDDVAVRQTHVSCNFVKLRLRQRAANSGRPEIDIAARR